MEDRDNAGTQDMTVLSNLSVEGINHNLKLRYDHDLVYTYTGTILISVNPYKPLSIYGSSFIRKYESTCTTPHIFAIAQHAYNSLIRSYDEANDKTINQSIVISGESGAGKTETTKFILQYLCNVTSNVSSWVENQILEANTILEAFGNAKTIRNDNSSRFGKFMQISFDSKWNIRGCVIQDYLLEQSRITFQSPGERNYHVFYQLLNAAQRSSEIANLYSIDPKREFKYLCSSASTTHDSLDPLLLALNILQIPQLHVNGLFSVLSSILHLGNLEFRAGDDGETAFLSDNDAKTVAVVCRLLGVTDQSHFVNVLLTRQINVRGNITEIPLRVNEASENRHAMSKALYSRCFGWLITHINERTNPGADCSKVIGLLDIFGFENFSTNSFEQLCINYANEKLHKFFNQAVFSIEQEIYRAEGLNISEITFTDNNAILELIEKPPRCLLKLLTEQCHLPKGSDLGFLNNLHGEFNAHPSYEKGERKDWEKCFTIKHYAGNVTYNTLGFVDKNRDVIQDNFFNGLSESSHEFIRCLANSLFDEQKTQVAATTIPRNTSKGRPTVAETFRGQLQQLVEVLGNTKAWYVRCIKPNEHKLPNNYDDGLVNEQLKYLGILEIIRIRKEGYPVHYDYESFAARFRVTGKYRTYRGARDISTEILAGFNEQLVKQAPPPVKSQNFSKNSTTYLKKQDAPYYYQLGNTKAFLKPQMHELLETTRTEVITKHVVTIQRVWKGYRARSEYRRIRTACITIQHGYRSMKTRLKFLRKRRAAVVIQKHMRGFFAREVFAALKEMRRVEEELRKREVEAEKKRSSIATCSDDGRSSYTSDEEQVIGGTKDVSLDNLFEFLLVNSGKSKDREAPDLDKLSYEMDSLVNDLNGLEQTVSDSVCSSISNFEFEEDEDEDDEEEEEENYDEDRITPTNKLPSPPASPPPLVPPPDHIPSVAKIVSNGHSARPQPPECHPRLPEPNVPPPPPPSTNQPPPPPPTTKAKGSSEEPIYESIQPRVAPQQAKIISPPQTQQLVVQDVRPPPPSIIQKPITQPLPREPPPQPQPPKQNYSQRVEKRVNEIMACTETQKPDPEIQTFRQFALQYFSLEHKGKTQTVDEYIHEHTNFTKHSTLTHPHVHLFDPSNISVSCLMFRDIVKLMKGELKPESEITALQTIIGYGIEREELRDEIYVQVLRQINSNGNIEYLERLYLVFCLAIVSFPPGKVLGRVIHYELSSISNGNAKLASQIKWILDNLQDLKIRGTVRRLPPSSVEIQAMKRLGTIVCRFFFLDGRTKAIDIHPTDTAVDAIMKLGEKIGVSSPSSLIENGWAIYQVRPNERVEEHVPAHTYVYDIIAHWELSNVDKHTGVSLGCGDNRFVFKKRLFKHNCREIPQDPVECALLYSQAVFCVVKRDDFPVAEKVALQLAGLQAQVLFGEPPQNAKLDNYTAVESFLPIRIAKTRPHANWTNILAQAHRTYGAGKSELVARVWYLSCVMQYPLYGSTAFHVVYRGYWVYGNSLVLAISSDGLSMVKPDDKFVIYEYAYNQIESIHVEGTENLLTVNLNRSLPPDTHKCFVFETHAGNEIAALVSSYCSSLSATKQQSLTKQSNIAQQLTNNDRMRLYGNVVNARKQLIDGGLLRRPEKHLINVNFLKNTLRRLSKNKIERMRQYEHAMMGSSEADHANEFPLEWWCYGKHAVGQSLTSLGNAELEATAVWVFQQLLNFTCASTSERSPLKSNENPETHAAIILQGIFEKIWRSDPLINEFYVQLIKQTTDHPEPNSKVNAKNWGVLSLMCSVIAPPDPLVRKYLNSHLKRCALTDYVTEEGKFARFAEKCLQHTITSSSVSTASRRQWPPSRNEIICTVNRKPITARFHFMDGKYHTLQFAPNDTALELLASLTQKIGLPSTCTGYAIYEVSTSPITNPLSQSSPQSGFTATPSHWERSLTPHEKPVEVIARWERQKATQSTGANANTPLFKFVVRKHLYESLDLGNPIEKELVYHQLLAAARNDRFPCSDTEAAMLVALQAQVELGDYVTSGSNGELEFPDYVRVSAHCLPTRIAALVSHEAVARHHQSLVGTLSTEAKKAVLNLMMSWPLFKCIIFDVTQSFTSNWPRNLWCCLDNVGLHLLPQKHKSSLCTFEYGSIKSYSPSPTCFMLVTRASNEGAGNSNKIVLSTNQGYQIAQLIKQFVYSQMNK